MELDRYKLIKRDKGNSQKCILDVLHWTEKKKTFIKSLKSKN